MLLTLMTLTALAPQGPGPSLAPVVINEYSFDDAGTDDQEFVELWNRTNAPIDISGWIVQGEEGTPGTPASQINPSFTFPAATIINPGQYIVVGNAPVPNVNFVVASNFLENGPGEGITLRDPALNVIDGVIYQYAVWTNPVPPWIEGTPAHGRSLLTESLANPATMQRKQDGYDSDNNGVDFVNMRSTPGAANGSNNVVALNYVQSCDAVAGTSLAADFATSFVAPRTADPASVPNSTSTNITLPPSPQGGNLLLMHDPTGGGDMNTLRCAVGEDFLVECYAWVSGGNPAFVATDGECWGIGIGTTDAYGSPPDLTGTYYATTSNCAGVGNREPGATGVAWIALTHAAQTSIFLVDFNDGGPGYTILGGPIVATPGVNDGWQRLRIRVSGPSRGIL